MLALSLVGASASASMSALACEAKVAFKAAKFALVVVVVGVAVVEDRGSSFSGQA